MILEEIYQIALKGQTGRDDRCRRALQIICSLYHREKREYELRKEYYKPYIKELE